MPWTPDKLREYQRANKVEINRKRREALLAETPEAREMRLEKARESSRRHYAQNRERVSAYRKMLDARPDQREKRLARKRRQYAALPADEKRVYRMWKKYGVPRDEARRIIAEANGLCAICGLPGECRAYGVGRRGTPSFRPVQSRLAVDHCHATGRVRGLLCFPCNRALGFFRDNPANLERAAAYLRAHETK